jgi:hypothetical protein
MPRLLRKLTNNQMGDSISQLTYLRRQMLRFARSLRPSSERRSGHTIKHARAFAEIFFN